MKFLKMVIIFITCCTFLSGCWDKVEIDRRIFISTIGVDSGKDIASKDIKAIKPGDPFQQSDMQRINVIYSFPDITQLGPEKGGTASDKNISVQAYSMEDAYTKANSKSSRSVHLGHTQLLMLSDDLMKYSNVVKEIIDYIQRQPELNREMTVVVAEGKTEDYIKYKPDTEKNIETYLSGLMENVGKSASILPINLNEFLQNLSVNGNAILPRVKLEKDKNELRLDGVALIKDYKLIGQLNPAETVDLELLRGKLVGGQRSIFVGGHPVDVEFSGMQRKIKVGTSGGKLAFYIDINLEGDLREFDVDKDVFSISKLDTLQEYFNESLASECEQVAKILQQRYEMDPIGLREAVEKYNPSIWQKVKGNWEKEFKDAVIRVDVATKIRRIGVTR
ncbi:MAG: Ger(x)C family spore germination protein [Bacillota bacterium]|nr:Ger(x)C family spore germination protein [Bacillota bacterium]